ncbi:MAG: cupredoxin domain-containing protein, partial [Gordonia sp. (in: high G+C Gram-positive bacteria)]|uniref:cupredoxin domain-containing protein n=1 Tax=Gordonia sp. (in: high G+C Gram-positive bacteria) TaxID=84139 RepID=UPI003BB7FD8E
MSATNETPAAPGTAQPPTRPMSWHRRAGMPVRIWMVVLIALGLTHWALPESRWLLVHVFTIGLVANSILLWSQTLAERFLGYHLPPDQRRGQLTRIYTLNVGLIVMIVGMVAGQWVLTLVGATAIAVVIAWHAAAMARLITQAQRGRAERGDAPAENALNAWFFVGSAALLPFGAAFGVAMAYGFADPEQAGFLLTHQALNIFGFLGLAAAGVLMLMFPRLLSGAGIADRRRPYALAVLIAGIAVICGGALADQPVLAAAGVMVYLAGWLIVVVPFVPLLRRRPPDSFATASITAALLWLLGSLVAYAALLLTGPFEAYRLSILSVWFLAGFAAQLLFGVMSHLLPTMMGGGAVTAAGLQEMNRWWLWRVLVINGGLLLWLLPLGSWAKVAVSSLVMLAFILFLPIMIASARAAMAVRKSAHPTGEQPSVAVTLGTPASSPPQTPAAPSAPAQQRGLQAIAAATALALVVAVGTAFGGSQSASVGDAAGTATPTGNTTTVAVEAVGMRFTPNTIQVPAGDKLVLNVTNHDSMVHDLVLATGESTGRIAPGATASLTVEVVGRSIDGWCSIVGHK